MTTRPTARANRGRNLPAGELTGFTCSQRWARPKSGNGEEMGRGGADDPDCRKPLWWPDYNFAPEMRRNDPRARRPACRQTGFNRGAFQFLQKIGGFAQKTIRC